jgi:hypothetical protein
MAAIEIADFPDEGVTLLPATDPHFDSQAQAILAGNAAPLFELKPLIVIVSNRNPRTVVAYTMSWTITMRNGISQTKFTQFMFPDAVAGARDGFSLLQGREIASGEQRLLGMGFEVWPPEFADSYRDMGAGQLGAFAAVTALAIELDAVIFEDGLLLGPDRSLMAEHFIEYVHAKQTIYRGIVVGLESGENADQLLSPLRAKVEARPRQLIDPMAHYRQMAAGEILKFHNRAALEAFRRTLRREPFAIKRLSGTSG